MESREVPLRKMISFNLLFSLRKFRKIVWFCPQYHPVFLGFVGTYVPLRAPPTTTFDAACNALAGDTLPIYKGAHLP